MKHYLALSAALAVALSSAHAQLTINNPAYSATTYYTHTNADSIISFDFGANGALYYQTGTPNYAFGGLYRAGGGVTAAVVPGSNSQFYGASVTAIGQSIYYNTSDASFNQLINRYGPLNGTPAAQVASTTVNYGLYGHDGRLFITGAPNFGANHIYYSNINADGSLANASPAIDLGEDSGASGPLTFNAQGDLYYSPGFGDLSIYRWTKSEVDAAIANPGVTAFQLGAANHQWLDYSSAYSEYASTGGGTSLLDDGQGHLLLTLTGGGVSSKLASFGVTADGGYNGSMSTVLTEAGRLGELRLLGNAVLLADGSRILQVVPEPSTVILLVAGAVIGLAAVRRPARA